MGRRSGGGGMMDLLDGYTGLRQCVQPLQDGGALSATRSSLGQMNLMPCIMAFILHSMIVIYGLIWPPVLCLGGWGHAFFNAPSYYPTYILLLNGRI